MATLFIEMFYIHSAATAFVNPKHTNRWPLLSAAKLGNLINGKEEKKNKANEIKVVSWLLPSTHLNPETLLVLFFLPPPPSPPFYIRFFTLLEVLLFTPTERNQRHCLSLNRWIPDRTCTIIKIDVKPNYKRYTQQQRRSISSPYYYVRHNEFFPAKSGGKKEQLIE